MGMSTHVVAIRPPDKKWLQMKAVWDACVTAGCPLPGKVVDFFDGEAPDPAGVLVDGDKSPWAKQWRDNSGTTQGIEIEIDKLPPDVKIVRVYNQW